MISRVFLSIYIGFFAVFASLSASADTFNSDPQIFKSNQINAIRGIINIVYLPVSDEVELGFTQSGYFIFTPYPCTIEAEGLDGEKVLVKNQQMFQLTPSKEQVRLFESMLHKPVEVEVSMMPAHTRYHRTPILLNVKSLRLIK